MDIYCINAVDLQNTSVTAWRRHSGICHWSTGGSHTLC